jgi:hypothetical protein
MENIDILIIAYNTELEESLSSGKETYSASENAQNILHAGKEVLPFIYTFIENTILSKNAEDGWLYLIREIITKYDINIRKLFSNNIAQCKESLKEVLSYRNIHGEYVL